jgi:N-acetylglutamate synthase-like GNAT family acetyltransferase
MHAEGAYGFLPFEEERCRIVLERCLSQPDSWCGLVAESGGEVVGMLIGCRSPYLFCSETSASDLALYMRPESRGAYSAVTLIRRFVGWARENGAREVCLSTSLNVATERTAGFIRKLGFTQVGGVFKQCLDLETAAETQG